MIMKNNLFAPVAIPTLNRYEHLRRCVESLSKCVHADKTELIIGLDYPPSDRYLDGYNKIKNYVGSIQGFKNVTVLYRETNLGAQQNWKQLIDYAFTKYEAVIMSEDDNEFSYLFLDYINQGLRKFWDDVKVSAICGYNPPLAMKEYPYNIYASYGYNAWGIGLWKDKRVKYDLNDIRQLLRRPSVYKKIYKRSPNLVYTLFNMLKENSIWDDTCGPFYNIVNDSYSIFPKISFVRNWGFDGSGLHCGRLDDQTYSSQEIYEGKEFVFDDIKIEETTNKDVRKYIRKTYNIKKRIKLALATIRFYMMN